MVIVDHDGHRRVTNDYFRRQTLPPGLAKRNALPPGLAPTALLQRMQAMLAESQRGGYCRDG